MADKKGPASVPKNVNDQLKHVTMAIYRKGGSSSGKDAFEEAFLKARKALVKQKYLAGGSEAGDLIGINATDKGQRLAAMHAGEGNGNSEAFDKLFGQFMERQMEKQRDLPGTSENASPVETAQAIERAAARAGDNLISSTTPGDRRVGGSANPPPPSTAIKPGMKHKTTHPHVSGTKPSKDQAIPRKGRIK